MIAYPPVHHYLDINQTLLSFQQVINTVKSKHYQFNTFDTIKASSRPMKSINDNLDARKLSFDDADTLSDMEKIITSTESLKQI